MVVSLGTLHLCLKGIEALPLSAELKNALRSIDQLTEVTEAYSVHMCLPSNDEFQPVRQSTEINGGESCDSCGLMGAYFEFSVDWPERKIIAILRPQSNDIDQIFLKCMNAILSLCFVQHQGFAIHAACVYLHNHAVLVAGRSGAGKSTLAARLSPPGQILDDDFSIIYRDNGRFWITGSPFGKDGRIHPEKSARFPLETIFFTRKAIHVGSLPLSIAQAYHNLAQHVFAFWALPRISSRLLDNIHLLCTKVPMYILHADSTESDCSYVSLVFKGIE
jgi:hypothetical protein